MVRVCKKECVIDTENSSADQLTCKVPPIATTRSNELFFITDEANLYGESYIYSGMTESQAKQAFDLKSLPGLHGTSANCHVGVQFADGFIGVLQELSFFLDYFNVNTIVDQLRFEASSDNFVSDIQEILVVGEEAHEGWNYYALNSTEVRYPYYRLTSAAAKGCDDIGEIRFIGHEVIDDENESFTCGAEIK